jgi:hypothetical protein
MSEEKKERRGFRVAISNLDFSDIIANALHLPVGSIRVHSVTDSSHWQSISVVIEGYDETFPILTEGCEPQFACLDMLTLKTEDGGSKNVIKGVNFTWLH